MRWEEEAKDRLRYYGQKKRAVEHLEEEIYRLEQEATALRGGILDGTRSRSAKNDRVLNNMVMRQELEWTLKDTRRWLRLTESAIDSLDEDLRQVAVYAIVPALPILTRSNTTCSLSDS